MVKVYQCTLVMRVLLYMFHRYGCTIILDIDMNVLVFSR